MVVAALDSRFRGRTASLTLAVLAAHRQCDHRVEAAAVAVDEADVAARVADDRLRQRKAQPGAAGFAVARGFEPGEGIEHVGEAILGDRSEEQTSELQSLMRSSYAVFCLQKKT